MGKKKTISYSKYGYIFSIPFVVAFCCFTLYPIVYTFFIAFTDLQGVANTSPHLLKGSEFFGNFKEILATQGFKTAFANTCKIWTMNFIPQMGLALLLTAWLPTTGARSSSKVCSRYVSTCPTS